MSKTKELARQVLPPFLTSTLQRAREGRWAKSLRPTRNSADVVAQAKRHLELAAQADREEDMPPSTRWETHLNGMRGELARLKTVQDVIYFGQGRMGFDQRNSALVQSPYFKRYEAILSGEFLHFADVIPELAESPYSLPESLARYDGRLVSNVLYTHIRYVLQCLTYVKEPHTICDVGTGYGAPARLWLLNPIHRPDLYILVDFPECLFFAEVFLKANFPNLRLRYVTDSTALDPEAVAEDSVLFCPINYVDSLSGLSLDLVINTGSLAEMTEEWVDFWMGWLDRQDCHYFYSLNYFAQPLENMAEAANAWSPRLGPKWQVRLQKYDPPLYRMQSPRNFAEILAEKQDETPAVDQESLAGRYELTKQRFLDGQTLMEALDVVRMSPGEDIALDLLRRCVTEMPTVPKEAYYLAEYLAKHGNDDFLSRNGKELDKVRTRLNEIRAGGREDVATGVKPYLAQRAKSWKRIE